MNTQTVVNKAVDVNRVARYTVVPVKTRAANPVKTTPRPTFVMDLNAMLTNGDPPKLMLWGSED